MGQGSSHQGTMIQKGLDSQIFDIVRLHMCTLDRVCPLNKIQFIFFQLFHRIRPKVNHEDQFTTGLENWLVCQFSRRSWMSSRWVSIGPNRSEVSFQTSHVMGQSPKRWEMDSFACLHMIHIDGPTKPLFWRPSQVIICLWPTSQRK